MDLDLSLWNSASYNVFKNSILKFLRPSPNKIFQWHNPKGSKLVTRLRLSLSHLWEYKFEHSFQDTLNPFCSSGLNIETKFHYFFHCPLFHADWSTLLNNINKTVTGILLYGNESFKDEVNLPILHSTIILFCPQIDLMNHFIFSKFMGVFAFIHEWTGIRNQEAEMIYSTYRSNDV